MPQGGHFRAHERRRVHLAASLWQSDSERLWQAMVVDLGLGGARLQLATELAPATQVVLRVVIPTRWDPLTLDAVVAWTERERAGTAWHSGIRFLHTDEQTPTALFDLLGAADYAFDP